MTDLKKIFIRIVVVLQISPDSSSQPVEIPSADPNLSSEQQPIEVEISAAEEQNSSSQPIEILNDPNSSLQPIQIGTELNSQQLTDPVELVSEPQQPEIIAEVVEEEDDDKPSGKKKRKRAGGINDVSTPPDTDDEDKDQDYDTNEDSSIARR